MVHMIINGRVKI